MIVNVLFGDLEASVGWKEASEDILQSDDGTLSLLCDILQVKLTIRAVNLENH